MRLLITGATGFLGRATALRLAAEGVSVRALIRAGRDDGAFERAGIESARGDVRDPAAVRDAMRACTHVIHLAAAKSARGVTRRIFDEVNVGGTRTVLDAARAEGVARVVYASTLGVHGLVTHGVLDETSPARPNTPYRTSKWKGEIVAREAHATHGLPVVIARISTVIGAGANGWVPFARRIAAGQLRLLGDGANHIDLLAVDDLIDGLWRCVSVPDIDGGCFVLGGGAATTMREFAEMVARALHVPAPARGLPAGGHTLLLRAAAALYQLTGYHWSYTHAREPFVADKRASIAHARSVLAFEPKRPLTSAVEAMVAQYVADGTVRAGGAM